MDRSNGYEAHAAGFIARRSSGIGAETVLAWAGTLPPGAEVLDLGCGTGIPVSRVLLEAGHRVYGVDASPTLAAVFHQNFPASPIVCEPVEECSFFNRSFRGIVAWGLLFLLPAETQATLLHRIAPALIPGGRLLFTAPARACTWSDALTGRTSLSLGAAAYRAAVAAAGLSLTGEYDDEGANHYYDAVRPGDMLVRPGSA